MDENTLRSCIRALDGQIASLHGSLHHWTALVIVGVVLEVVFVVHQYLDDRSDWRKARTRGYLTLPEKPKLGWSILEMLSVAVVVAGIWGELDVDIRASRLETRLQDANGRLETLLSEKAGSAVASAERAKTAANGADKIAKDAGMAAGDAKADADSAQTEIRNLMGQVEAASEEIVRANKTAADANARVEDERTKRLLLAVSLLPRSFPDQSGAMKTLSSFPRTPVVIAWVNDLEAREFAEKINFVFSTLRWPVSVRKCNDSGVSPGVTVESGLKSEPNQTFEQGAAGARVAEAFKSILSARDIDIGYASDAATLTMPNNTLVITIGKKPNRVLDDTLRELSAGAPRRPSTPWKGVIFQDSLTSLPEPK